jgi:uncharacterized protein
MSKLFVESNQFQNLSLDLAKKIEKSEFKPDVIVGVSRGGCIPGIIIHEYFDYKGITCDYYNISTKLYNNDNTKGNKVFIDVSEHAKKQLRKCNNILIVDDVFDTGYTMLNLCNYLYTKLNITSDKIRIATVYYKSTKNETTISPDFYTQEREEWIVFPHELLGLSDEEVVFKNRLIS